MILAVDIGNTSIRLGLLESGNALHRAKLAADRRKSADEYAVLLYGILTMRSISLENIEGAIIASVVPTLTYTLTRALEGFGIKPLTVGSGIKTGLNIRIDSPGILGADIVAGTVAAMKLAKPPLIVIDLGTATTLTVINAKGELCGCVIAPGVKLSLDALTERCSLLGEVSLARPERLLGTNSADSLNSGVVYGTALMLDGYITRLKREYGFGEELSVIATGGLSELIIPLCEQAIRREPDLTLRGLERLYRLNAR